MKGGKSCPSMFNLEPPNRCYTSNHIFILYVRAFAFKNYNKYDESLQWLFMVKPHLCILKIYQHFRILENAKRMPIKYLICISNLINWKQYISFSELDEKLLCSSNLHHYHHHHLSFGQITQQVHKSLFLLSHAYYCCTRL